VSPTHLEMPEAYRLAHAHEDLGRSPIEDDIMVQTHPAAKKRPQYHPYESYSSSLPEPAKTYDNKRRRAPWSPFRYRLDFQLAEFMRQKNFNNVEMDKLLSIVASIAEAPSTYSLVDAKHVTDTWKASTKDRNTRVRLLFPPRVVGA
jgi:hypothetical protein